MTAPAEVYPAALYAALHAGNAGDVEYYRRLCAGAGSVLELGCGTGRIAARLGPDLVPVGLDRDREALAVAAARGVETVAGDIRDFRLGRRFERIIAPYNALYCLLDPAEVVACLTCVRRHLAPGAVFVFDGYAADHVDLADPAASGDGFEPVGEIVVDGRRWAVHERSVAPGGAGRLDVCYRHIPDDGGAPVDGWIAQRFITSDEVPDLLAAAGMMMVGCAGDFAGRAYGPHSEHLIVHAAAVS